MNYRDMATDRACLGGGVRFIWNTQSVVLLLLLLLLLPTKYPLRRLGELHGTVLLHPGCRKTGTPKSSERGWRRG